MWFGSFRLEIGKKFKDEKAYKELFNFTIIDLVLIIFQKLWLEDKKDAAMLSMNLRSSKHKDMPAGDYNTETVYSVKPSWTYEYLSSIA